MKIYKIKYMLLALLVLGGSVSCEEFLDRPTDDSYTIDTFYQNDEQLYQAVNSVYGSPWYDFQRGFIQIGDGLAGNFCLAADNAYTKFLLNNTDADVNNASASLWSVNAYCNGVIQNVDAKSGDGVSQKAKNTVKGEAMVWKAMTYFYLVRCFGAVPIIHDNTEIIVSNTSANLKRNKIEDVYKYITLILKDAINLLPEQNQAGRIDKYSACGLLAKVYLTMSGVGMNGSRNAEHLTEAAKYAKMVIEESGRVLHPVYGELFQLKGNFNPENLISWHWVTSDKWTSQNSFQCDLAINNFSDAVNSWADWRYVTIDLQSAFNDSADKKVRNNKDARRKASLMMYGDHYDHLYVEFGGFNYSWNNSEYSEYKVDLNFTSPSGSSCAKHIVGRQADADAQGSGYQLDRMHTPLSTHLLRLADVYLVYAEAKLGNSGSTSDASALVAFNAVRERALGSNYVPMTSITFEDIDLERRKELALEGDRWYDLVRLHYYKPAEAKAIIAEQERGTWEGLEDFYVNGDDSNLKINSLKVSVSDDKFLIPFPEVDLSMNPSLMDDPVSFDFGSIGYN